MVIKALFLWFLKRMIFWVNFTCNNNYEYEIGYRSSSFYSSLPFRERLLYANHFSKQFVSKNRFKITIQLFH